MAKAKTLDYAPSVPQGPIPQEVEAMDDEVRAQGFLVGKQLESASMALRYKYPQWAALYDQIWYMLNNMFGGE